MKQYYKCVVCKKSSRINTPCFKLVTDTEILFNANTKEAHTWEARDECPDAIWRKTTEGAIMLTML